jgi:hypothetical protein
MVSRRANGAAPQREVRVRDWRALASRLFEALVAGYEQRARRDFERLAAGVPLTDLFHAGQYWGMTASVTPGLLRATARLAASRYMAASCTTRDQERPRSGSARRRAGGRSQRSTSRRSWPPTRWRRTVRRARSCTGRACTSLITEWCRARDASAPAAPARAPGRPTADPRDAQTGKMNSMGRRG